MLSEPVEVVADDSDVAVIEEVVILDVGTLDFGLIAAFFVRFRDGPKVAVLGCFRLVTRSINEPSRLAASGACGGSISVAAPIAFVDGATIDMRGGAAAGIVETSEAIGCRVRATRSSANCTASSTHCILSIVGGFRLNGWLLGNVVDIWIGYNEKGCFQEIKFNM